MHISIIPPYHYSIVVCLQFTLLTSVLWRRPSLMAWKESVSSFRTLSQQSERWESTRIEESRRLTPRLSLSNPTIWAYVAIVSILSGEMRANSRREIFRDQKIYCVTVFTCSLYCNPADFCTLSAIEIFKRRLLFGANFWWVVIFSCCCIFQYLSILFIMNYTHTTSGKNENTHQGEFCICNLIMANTKWVTIIEPCRK